MIVPAPAIQTFQMMLHLFEQTKGVARSEERCGLMNDVILETKISLKLSTRAEHVSRALLVLYKTLFARVEKMYSRQYIYKPAKLERIFFLSLISVICCRQRKIWKY
jgi:hypothetical protein